MLAAVEQALGSGPDFVVSSVAGPASATPGQQISVSVTVCNQGDIGASTQVELYLSADTTITPRTPSNPSSPDAPIGMMPTGYLNPAQCLPLVITAYAGGMPDGTYYIGAVADPTNGTTEQVETNNTRAGNKMGLGYKPDFTLTALSGPVSATPGQPIAITATVCNQGTQSAPGAQLEVFLSSDAVLTTPPAPSPDPFVGSTWVSGLQAGQCQAVTVNGYASVPMDGAYNLFASVDTMNSVIEFMEDNNVKLGAKMGVGYRPDLYVSAVTGAPSAQPGSPYVVTATVCNQGTQSSGSVQVEIFLSADTTLVTPPSANPDPFVGPGMVNPLQPGQCQAVTVNGYVSVPTNGGYNLVASVDTQNYVVELQETNNVKFGAKIGVGYGPDYVVSALSGPASAMPGNPLVVTATVCNQGTIGSGGVPVEIYLSSDTVITPPMPPSPSTDSLVGMGFSGPLAAGQCVPVTINGYTSVPVDGPYYLAAFVDPMNNVVELLEDNNTRLGAKIGVGYKPDLIVSALSGPPSAMPGSSMSVTATVCNQGTQSSNGAPVEIYLSTDTTITAMSPPGPNPDPLVGVTWVNPLQPGQCQAVTVLGYASVPMDGAYYLAARADPVNNVLELQEDNNDWIGAKIGVGNKPDYIVSSVTGPNSVTPGSPLAGVVTVCNQGTQQGPGASVELYASLDTTITPGMPPPPGGDIPLGVAFTTPLLPGQCQTVTVNGYAPSGPDAAYFLGGAIDTPNSIQELMEDNNTRASAVRTGVGFKADFVITAISGPVSAQPGAPMTVATTVCNQGTQSGSTMFELYLSSDTTITPNGPTAPSPDLMIGNAPTPMLAAGQCQVINVTAYAYVPTDGAYYFGAVVDPMNYATELLEENNVKLGARIGVGNKPDYIVSSVTGPVSAQPGASVNVSATVCNQGTQVGGSAQVEIYLSADTVISPLVPPMPPGPPLDTLVASGSVPPLAPGVCQTLNLSGFAYVPTPGAYYYGAAVDPFNSAPELIEDNNTKVGTRTGVGNGPDLYISTVTGPTSVSVSGSFTASVKVCNQGTQSGMAPVELYFSADTTITPYVPGPPPTDMPLGVVYPVNLAPGQCQTLTTTVYPNIVGPGQWYLGAYVDPQGYLNELLEDNNAKAGTRITVTP